MSIEAVFLPSLGWALVHVVWQITALALLLALLLPRLKSAHQRYWAAFTALVAAFGVFCATFAWVFADKWGTTFAIGTASAPYLFFQGGTAPIPAPDFVETFSHWLEEHTAIVVMCWLLGFAVSLFRLLGGMYYLHRLQRNSASFATVYWQEKMSAMAGQLGLMRPIKLLESALARSPMALGYFKPVIFFPLGLLNQLSPAEVEAILAHELAHIARRDWLFNLVQAFIETLFYFHPAMWWMSSVVRTERENCCDDTAVQLTGSRVILAKALLHLQQLHLSNAAPVLALSAKGRPHFFHRFSLLTRIQRILNQPSQQKSLIMEKFVATVLLLGVLASVGMRANGSPQLEAFKTALSETTFGWLADLPQAGVNDSVPKPPRRIQKIVREEDGKRVEMEMKDGEVTRLNIDGQEIPANELTQHRGLTNDLRRDMAPPPVPPIPPTPPVAPVPPFPGVSPVAPVPPVPPFPGEDGLGFHFDGPGSVSRLSTTKDEDGNTVIRLERGGKPVEIKVKNGEVWVDGKRVENESSLELPGVAGFGEGFHFDLDGTHLLRPENGENFYFYHDADVVMMPSPDLLRLGGLKELELARAQLMQAEKGWKMSEKDRAKHEKAMQKAHKELQKAQKEIEKQHRKMEENRLDMLREQRNAQ